MDLKLSKETIAVKETVLDNCYEQAVETDYILPDYYPDIFRVIKCRIMPRIVSHSIIGSDLSKDSKKLSYELEAVIKIWYLSENSKVINCIEQKMSFSKSLEAEISSDQPEVSICPKTDYVNCRVINQRRLDIRGAISTKVKICDEKKQSVISNACGCGVQLKKTLINFPAIRLCASKKITVIEELELGIAKPPILSVIKSDSKIIAKEHKVITNKLVAKGEAQVEMLYTCQKKDEHGIESMKFSIPFSQIIDIEGIDEGYDVSIDIIPSSCDIITKGSGEATSFECELVLNVSCFASKSITSDIIEDAYSTCYDCEIETGELKTESRQKAICDNISCKSTLSLNDSEIAQVLDCSCETTNVSTHYSHESECYIINGNINYCCLVETKDGFPVVVEGDGVFEHSVKCSRNPLECYVEPKITVSGCSYTLSGESSIEITCEILIEGAVYEKASRNVITDIKISTENKKECNSECALKLYYADKDEDIWEIAKRNSTSVQAIMEENDMSADRLTEKGMLLIPIIS